MNIIIIEDETLAAKRLSDLILRYDKKINILAKIQSVKKSVEWFMKNPEPDLVFMDIQLGDGLSFDIFEQIKINCPIIFTTAFDEYAIQAFKVNSIDYLLKPLDFDELSNALKKFENNLMSKTKGSIYQYSKIEEVVNMLTKNYKERFMVKIGVRIKSIETMNISYFFSHEKATYISTKENRNYVIDYSLDQIEKLINPKYFFRINRKYIINISHINDIITYSKNRLKINMQNSDIEDFIVSREKVGEFKKRLG